MGITTGQASVLEKHLPFFVQRSSDCYLYHNIYYAIASILIKKGEVANEEALISPP
jgi:hypothetical protein